MLYRETLSQKKIIKRRRRRKKRKRRKRRRREGKEADEEEREKGKERGSYTGHNGIYQLFWH